MSPAARQTKAELTTELNALRQRVTELKDAEAARRESEARYRSLFELESDAIFLIDNGTGRLLEANYAATLLYGYSCAELLTMKNTDLSAEPEETQRITQGTPILVDNRVTIPVRLHRKKDGTIFPVEITGRFFDWNGRPVHIAAIRDITDRQQVEAALQQSNEKYRAIVEATSDYIMRYDRAGRHLFGNSAALKVTGVTLEAYVGKTHRELGFPEPLCRLWEENLEKVFQTGQAVTLEFDVELAAGRKFLELRLCPEFGPDGGVNTVVGIARDMTERKQAEAALRADEEFLRNLLEHAPVSIYVTDTEGRLRLVNWRWEADTARPRAEALGQPLERIFPAPTARKFSADNQKVIETGQVLAFEEVAEAPVEPHHFYTVKFPLRDAQGRVEAVGGISLDVTERNQAEAALSESEQRFRSLLQDLPAIAVQGYAPDGTTQYWNRASELFYGYSAQEALGRNLLELIIPPEMREGVTQAIQQMAETGQPIPAAELSLMRKDGSRIAVFSSHALVRLPGRAPELFCIDLNLTERNQAEAALRESEERFRLAYDTSPDAININRLEDGLYVDVNQGFTALTGFTREEALGNTSLEINIWYDPADRQKLVAALRAQGYCENLEARFRRKDGSVTTALLSARVIMLKGVPHILSITRDIGERKQMEQALRESETKYRTLIQYSSDPIFSFNPDETYRFVNEAFARPFGKTPAEIIGQTPHAIFPYAEAEKRLTLVRRVFQTGEKGEIDVKVVTATGEERFFLTIADPIKDEQGAVLWVACISKDITGRKRAEEALKDSEAQFRAFMENLPGLVLIKDHELRPIYFNNQFGKFFPAQEWLGKTPEETFPPDVAAAMRAADLKAFNEGYVSYEEKWLDKLGAERIYETRKFVIDHAGLPPLLGAIITDITARRQAEAAVRESEARYRVLFENVVDSIVVTDPETGRLLQFNRYTHEHLGYTAEEFAKLSAFEVDTLTPEQTQALIFEPLQKTGQAQFETQHRAKTGELYDMLLKLRLITYQGKTAILGIGHDITERKRAEAAVRESEARLRQITASMREAIWLRDTRTLEVLYVNPAYETLWGRPCESLYQNPASFLEAVHPEDKARVTEAIQKQYQGVFFNQEYRILRPDGGLLWIWGRTFPIYDAAGQLIRVTAIAEDITERKRIDESLKASREYLAKLINTIGDPVLVKDARHRFVLVNDAECALTGYPREALLGKTDADFFPREQVEVFWKMDDQVLETGVDNINEESLTDGVTGQRLTIVTHKTRYVDPAGNRFVVAVIRDITARKRAEDALRNTHEQLTATLNALPDLLFEVDSDERFCDYRAPHGDLLYVPPEMFLGKTVGEVLPAEAARVITQALAEARVTGWHRGASYSLPLPDGEHWFELSIAAKGDPHSPQVRFIALVHDITKRKQMEEALRETSERLTHMLANSPTAIYALRVEGAQTRPVWISGNVETILAASVAEALRSDWWAEHLYPEDRPRALASLAHLLEDYYQHEYRFVRDDGRVIWVHDERRLLRDAAGQPREIIGAWTDITERKQMEEALRQLNTELEHRVEARSAELRAANAELSATNAQLLGAMRAKDEFLSTMSHELRTPLTAILGLTELLQLQTPDPLTEKQARYLELVHQSGEHLLALINDVLDLSKVSAGRLELELYPVSVAEICQTAIRLVTPQADKKQIALALTPDSAVRVIRADARRLTQILVNLLGNAVKFTPGGGKVGLAVVGDELQGRANFTVWDTGVGIAAEDMPRLFQDFVQLDARLAREYEGTGLGLAMVRRLAELHGGQVTVESEGPGKGSRFTVSLPWETDLEAPAEREPLARAPRETGLAPAPAPDDAPLILVVDDQPALLVAVQNILTIKAYRVETVQDSRLALARARALRPALMLVDIQMPHLDGLGLIRQLRADAELAAVPIIALTALVLPGDRERCLQAGANEYLSKPVAVGELLHCIRTLLAPR